MEPAEQGGWARRAPGIVLAGLVGAALLAGLLLCRSDRPQRPEPKEAPPRDFARFATPGFPIDRGEALVLLIGMDCSRCVETARRVARFDLQAHGLHALFLLFGKAEEVDVFVQDVGDRVPHVLVSPRDYAEFAGDDPPTVYLLRNGKSLACWGGMQFNSDVLLAELSRQRAGTP